MKTVQLTLPLNNYAKRLSNLLQKETRLERDKDKVRWEIADLALEIKKSHTVVGLKKLAARVGASIPRLIEDARVAELYPAGSRNYKLTFNHYKLICASRTNSQRRKTYIKKAIEAKWTPTELRRELYADQVIHGRECQCAQCKAKIAFEDTQTVRIIVNGQGVKLCDAECAKNYLDTQYPSALTQAA